MYHTNVEIAVYISPVIVRDITLTAAAALKICVISSIFVTCIPRTTILGPCIHHDVYMSARHMLLGRHLIFGDKFHIYRYPISWEASLDPSDSYFLFDDFVDFIHIEHICSFFVSFFSATIDGRNLIFGYKLHIGTPYRGKRRGYNK